MSPAYETIVVGAGPTGAMAAWELARRGRSVALLERRALPRPKTCGGGLVWRGRALLPAALALPIERECRVVRLGLGENLPVHAVERGVPLVSMTMRADLDLALVELARSAGAEIRAPVELRGLVVEHGVARLETSAGEFQARCVVGADGATGVAARLAGWDEPLRTVPALEAEVEVSRAGLARHAAAAAFDFGVVPHGYAWVFPKREHLSIGVLSMRRGTKDLGRELERYLARLDLGPARIREQSGYVIPVRPRAQPARAPVLLVGDAAGLVDPLTAEGISLALHSGRLAGASIAEARGEPARAAREYRAALRREILPELRRARCLAHLLYEHPRLARSVLARGTQSACEALADVVCGTRSYRALFLDPRAWLRLAGLRRDRAAT